MDRNTHRNTLPDGLARGMLLRAPRVRPTCTCGVRASDPDLIWIRFSALDLWIDLKPRAQNIYIFALFLDLGSTRAPAARR